MDRIIYAMIAAWNYGVVVLADSVRSPVFLGFAFGLILFTLSHLLVQLQSPKKARTLLKLGFRYVKDPGFVKLHTEPKVVKDVEKIVTSTKMSAVMVGYGLLAIALLCSLLIRLPSL